MADKDQAAQDQAAADKPTFLILHLGDKRDLFLEIAESEAAGTFFKNGPLRGFLSATREGALTGAIALSLGVKKEGTDDYENVNAGVLFRKDGEKGAFLSGYVGGLTVEPGKKEGVEFYHVTKVNTDADGKTVGTVSITADIRGPKAEKILAALPVISRPAKDAPAEGAEAAASKPSRPKM